LYDYNKIKGKSRPHYNTQTIIINRRDLSIREISVLQKHPSHRFGDAHQPPRPPPLGQAGRSSDLPPAAGPLRSLAVLGCSAARTYPNAARLPCSASYPGPAAPLCRAVRQLPAAGGHLCRPLLLAPRQQQNPSGIGDKACQGRPVTIGAEAVEWLRARWVVRGHVGKAPPAQRLPPQRPPAPLPRCQVPRHKLSQVPHFVEHVPCVPASSPPCLFLFAWPHAQPRQAHYIQNYRYRANGQTIAQIYS
jgi:hypothetical protein